MIWFACAQCGKRQRRPDEEAGTLVFCECGHGNRVPWESTAAGEDLPPPPPPRRRPMADEPPLAEMEEMPPRCGRAEWEERRRDPSRCLHHPDVAAERTCEACGEGFCAACLVTLKGQTLCGPCKNYRVNCLNTPPRTSGLAITALVLGFVCGPLILCLIPGPSREPFAMFIGLLGFVGQVGALMLGALALYKIETAPRLQGQSMAITGMVTGFVALVFLFATWILVGSRGL
jgi:hypothetical protein